MWTAFLPLLLDPVLLVKWLFRPALLGDARSVHSVKWLVLLCAAPFFFFCGCRRVLVASCDCRPTLGRHMVSCSLHENMCPCRERKKRRLHLSSARGVEVHSVYYSVSLRTVVPVCAIAKCCMYSTAHCYREHAVSIQPLIVAEMWHRGPQTDYLCINACPMDCVSHFVSMKAKKCLICWLYYWLGISLSSGLHCMHLHVPTSRCCV